MLIHLVMLLYPSTKVTFRVQVLIHLVMLLYPSTKVTFRVQTLIHLHVVVQKGMISGLHSWTAKVIFKIDFLFSVTLLQICSLADYQGLQLHHFLPNMVHDQGSGQHMLHQLLNFLRGNCEECR